jgi:hypothetical protein
MGADDFKNLGFRVEDNNRNPDNASTTTSDHRESPSTVPSEPSRGS